MTAQRIIYFAIFFLFLIGACVLTAYAFVVSFGGFTSPLFYASTAIAWGVILLTLYLVFERKQWEWWS